MQPGTGTRFDFSHRLVKVMEKNMVTQKKEMKDLDAEYTTKHHMEQQTLMEKMTERIKKDNKIYNMFSERSTVTSFFGHEEEEEEVRPHPGGERPHHGGERPHHGEDQPHPGGEVRRVQRRLPDPPDLGRGRHGHGGEDHDSGPEELTRSSSEQADHDWEQEGDRIAEREQARRNHKVDIENMHWQMLEHSSQRLGHILADGSEETNNEELERIVPSRPEVFSWYREQLLLIGEGVETHLTIAARELSRFINTILDEAMN